MGDGGNQLTKALYSPVSDLFWVVGIFGVKHDAETQSQSQSQIPITIAVAVAVAVTVVVTVAIDPVWSALQSTEEWLCCWRNTQIYSGEACAF